MKLVFLCFINLHLKSLLKEGFQIWLELMEALSEWLSRGPHSKNIILKENYLELHILLFAEKRYFSSKYSHLLWSCCLEIVLWTQGLYIGELINICTFQLATIKVESLGFFFLHINSYCNEREKNITSKQVMAGSWILKAGMPYTMLAERWQCLILWDNSSVNRWDCFKLLQWTILSHICMLITETWCKTNRTEKYISLNQLFKKSPKKSLYICFHIFASGFVKIHLDITGYHSESYNTDKRLLNLIVSVKGRKSFER